MNREKDFCKYVDVFYGSGEVDHYAKEGLASKWFYIKALCGNTIPHAVLPFGKMSVGAYSGGYSSGYGTHCPNFCGGVPKLSDTLKIRGFSHLHQAGVGGIRYYYNYAVTTPFYGEAADIAEFYPVDKEEGKPGFYAAEYRDVRCELTANENTAYHQYHFYKEGGRVAVDFSNDGLHKSFGDEFFAFVKEPVLERVSDREVLFSGIFSGVKLYFCVKAEGQNVRSRLFYDDCELTGEEKNGRDKEIAEKKSAESDYSVRESENKPADYDVQPTAAGMQCIACDMKILDNTKLFGCIFDFDGADISLKLSYSTLGYAEAKQNVENATASFAETAAAGYDIWNTYLSAIEISTEDQALKQKFYSNFYHSLMKPIDMTGEDIMGLKGDVVSDFATFWDQYKTLFPMIFLLYPKMSEKIVKSLKNISESFGKICCSFGASEIFPCEEQAKMLGILTLIDAYYSGVESATEEVITDCIKRELLREDFKCFLEDGVFERYTHIIDTTDACLVAAEITKDEALREKLLTLAENWRKAYDEDGIMSTKSVYYEGNRYTYSFRLQKNMEERIALAGGKDAFIALLDDFFGFGKESIVQICDKPAAFEEIEEILHKYNRFEGFNNECDMETPFAYVLAGCPEKTQEIVHESVVTSFGLGRGGLPGNNDSGGLSSCFVWNALGLFPASGRGEVLIGSPHFDKAVLKLANGKKLEITAHGVSGECYHVKSVVFNGKAVENYRIPMPELMQGGELVFEMM